MIIFFTILISILSSFLGFTVYKLIKLDSQLKTEEMRSDTGWEQYHKVKADRELLNDILERRNLEISSLKKELSFLKSSLKDLNKVPVTRIETYTPQMKAIAYSVELCRSDFGEMPKEEVIEIAKDELYKNIFEIIKPFISINESDDIYRMKTIVSGKIIVEDRR